MISTIRDNEKQQAIFEINNYVCSYKQQVATFSNKKVIFFFLLENVVKIKQSKGNFSILQNSQVVCFICQQF